MPPTRAARSAPSPRTPVSPATWRCPRGCRGSWPPKPASCSRSCRRPAAPPAVTRSTTSRTSGARCGISSPPKPRRPRARRPRAHEPRAPMSEGWQSYVRRIEELAARSGLEFHRVDFEAVPDSFMMEIAVYGLPVRMPHWSFGVRYIYQLIQRHMGHSRLFEVVFPGNPGHAYLAASNGLAENILVTAHVLGHADFARNNLLFRRCQEQVSEHIVEHAANHARQIQQAIETHGAQRVEGRIERGLDAVRAVGLDGLLDLACVIGGVLDDVLAHLLLAAAEQQVVAREIRVPEHVRGHQDVFREPVARGEIGVAGVAGEHHLEEARVPHVALDQLIDIAHAE